MTIGPVVPSYARWERKKLFQGGFFSTVQRVCLFFLAARTLP